MFGAGGDRDAGKRPLMGEIAAKMADNVIVTDDNPRSENPAKIRMQIKLGIAWQVRLARGSSGKSSGKGEVGRARSDVTAHGPEGRRQPLPHRHTLFDRDIPGEAGGVRQSVARHADRTAVGREVLLHDRIVPADPGGKRQTLRRSPLA